MGIGHRGGEHLAPENTLPAFRLAAEAGDAIEFDVRATAGGELVVLHDRRLRRTGRGVHANDFVDRVTLEQFRATDFGSWFDAEFAGVCGTTLDEVVAAFRHIGLFLDAKFDGVPRDGLAAFRSKLLALPDRFGLTLEDWSLVVESQSPTALWHLHREDPHLPLLQLFPGDDQSGVPIPPDVYRSALSTVAGYAVAIGVMYYDEELVEAAHKLGLAVFVYTISTPEDAARAVSAVNGSFATDPSLIRAAVGGHVPTRTALRALAVAQRAAASARVTAIRTPAEAAIGRLAARLVRDTPGTDLSHEDLDAAQHYAEQMLPNPDARAIVRRCAALRCLLDARA